MSDMQPQGGGFPRWLIWIGVIVVFDALSLIFHWGWILY
jgi:hypothetical protein